jgi:hypothetical protein
MKARVTLVLALMAAVTVLSGCGTSVYSVKIPFSENPEAVYADAPHVAIEDMRDQGERVTHVNASIFSCQRWYGDDTYQPPKIVYLDSLIANRVPPSIQVSIRLDKFDTIEYCDNTAERGAAAAAAGATAASGMPIFLPANTKPGGDSVHVHLAGEINGVPFDVKRAFDYDLLPYKFLEMPAANSTYRELLRKMLGDMADEIVAKLPAAPAG